LHGRTLNFEPLLDDYEAEHFHRNASSRRIADVTLDLMATFPAQRMPPSSWVHRGAQALMDPQLLDALGYPPPNRRLVAGCTVPCGRVGHSYGGCRRAAGPPTPVGAPTSAATGRGMTSPHWVPSRPAEHTHNIAT
jgi:hypothetical protein